MQKITVLCVGKLKEKFYLEAAAEYIKRLQRCCKLEVDRAAGEQAAGGALPRPDPAGSDGGGRRHGEKLPLAAPTGHVHRGQPCPVEEMSQCSSWRFPAVPKLPFSSAAAWAYPRS